MLDSHHVGASAVGSDELTGQPQSVQGGITGRTPTHMQPTYKDRYDTRVAACYSEAKNEYLQTRGSGDAIKSIHATFVSEYPNSHFDAIGIKATLPTGIMFNSKKYAEYTKLMKVDEVRK
jgi:hypothetical protein